MPYVRNHLGVGASIFFATLGLVMREDSEAIFLSACAEPRSVRTYNKITRPRKFFEVALSRGRRYNSSHPGPSSTSRRSRGRVFFIFTRAIYVAKINGWRKRVSGDTLLKIQPQVAAVHQALMSHGNYVWKNKRKTHIRKGGKMEKKIDTRWIWKS